MDKKTILITGGAGFIGRGLTARLQKEGYNVRILTRRDPSTIEQQGVEFAHGDYGDAASLRKAMEGCFAVYHLAAAISAHSKEEFYRANTLSTKNMVDAASAVPGLECFVYVSSLAAGGPSADPAKPRDENLPPSPVSAYGETKLGGEKEVARLPANIRRVVLRPPIVYGKYDAGISKIARWVKRGIMINMCAGDTYFNFIYLDDLVECLYRAMADVKLAGGTYFVCTPKQYTWLYFIAEMAKAMKKPMPKIITLSPGQMMFVGRIYQVVAKVFRLEPVFNPDKAVEASAGNWIASPALWMEKSGFKEWTPLEEGLKRTFGE